MREPNTIRRFQVDDLSVLQDIRQRAFKPIFKSFRSIVGEEIFELEFCDCDQKQADYLQSICMEGSDKDVYVVMEKGKIAGFMAISLDRKNAKGEIDLNAVDPDFQSKNLGQSMYEFAIKEMKNAGIKIVKVSTGNDSSHVPARQAYKKAGFEVSLSSVTMFKLIED